MKQIKLSEIISVSQILKKLMNVHFANFKVVHSLVELARFNDKEVEFFANQMNKLKAEYGIVEGEQPKDPDAINKFNEEYKKLLETEVEFPEDLVVTISEKDFLSASDYPTPIEMISLSNFVQFN